MSNRLKLQAKLEELLGSRNVYYQPPESLKMQYPAIVYSKSDVDRFAANNTVYLLFDCYDITVIDKKPDNPIINKILSLPNSSYDRGFKSDNLNHDILTLYY